MSGERRLIVNADDFGRSRGINEGVLDAHLRGILTSASLMVRWPTAAEAARSAVAGGLSLGLHADLGEWLFEDEWRPVYTVVDLDSAHAVEVELQDQLATFRRLVGRDPTHLDSHQHVHEHEPVAAVFARVAAELRVPLRNHSAIHYCGDFYGQTLTGSPYEAGIGLDRLLQIVRSLPAGATELACHPARHADVESVYRSERERELDVLCDPRIRRAVEEQGIVLCSFADLPRA